MKARKKRHVYSGRRMRKADAENPEKCWVCGVDWDVPGVWHGLPALKKSWPHEICEYEENVG